MGGKAFPDLIKPDFRLNAKEYSAFEYNTINKLTKRFRYAIFVNIPHYSNKCDFGDLDILYSGNHIDSTAVVDELKAVQIVRNGPVVSYAVPSNIDDNLFQVDLIYSEPKALNFARSYYAFNDLGNILGRIFHRAGFKLGHKGLLYVVRDSDNQDNAIEEVVVMDSWKEALEFAGYDYRIWQQGFNELTDIFEYAVSNKIVAKNIFALSEMSHDARVRDKKRITYQKFLTWLQHSQVKEYETISKCELRKLWLEKAFQVKPEFKQKYSELQELMFNTKVAKQYFNGIIVGEITGLQGKALGQFIQAFIHEYIEKQFNLNKVDWVLWVKDAVPQHIKLFFEQYNLHSTN